MCELFFFFKQKTAYEMRISDWSSDVCSSDLCCPINTVDQVFEDPQVVQRNMKISMPHPLAGRGAVDLIGNPIKLSETPVSYRRPPPVLGEQDRKSVV